MFSWLCANSVSKTEKKGTYGCQECSAAEADQPALKQLDGQIHFHGLLHNCNTHTRAACEPVHASVVHQKMQVEVCWRSAAVLLARSTGKRLQEALEETLGYRYLRDRLIDVSRDLWYALHFYRSANCFRSFLSIAHSEMITGQYSTSGSRTLYKITSKLCCRELWPTLVD